MAPAADIVALPTTLDSLSSIRTLHSGLIAVTFFGFLSFTTSIVLFSRLAWRLLTWTRKSAPGGGNGRINQFVILLFNLIFADMQQSVAFLLNAHWLASNAIIAGSGTCWAQGWFVSTGDLGSGLFTLLIAVHAFADIVFDYRLGQRAFTAVIAGLWVFNYTLPVIGIAMHPHDFYERAGAWCWISGTHENDRLTLHYLFVITAEFGTVLIYAALFIILRRRVRAAFYDNSETASRAQSAAKIIILYPIVYVVCTLPLVKARLTGMANQPVSFVELTIAGAMITSNGWLDVLLYTVTRHTAAFNVPEEGAGILDTFRHRPDQGFGTTTVIEANRIVRSGSRRRQSKAEWSGSTEELFGGAPPHPGVKAETTVMVQSDVMEMEPLPRHVPSAEIDMMKESASWDGRSQKSRLSRK